MYHENEVALVSIVVMANLVYGLTTLYYQLCWKLGISKNEQGRKLRKCLLVDCQRCKKEITKSTVEKYYKQEQQ